MVNNYVLRNILFFFVNIAITICDPLLKLYVKTKIKYRRAKRYLSKTYNTLVQKVIIVHTSIVMFIVIWLYIIIDFLIKLREKIKRSISYS